MTVVNEKERTVWRPDNGKFEKVANPYSPNYDDSIPPNRAARSNHQTFVVEWQMITEGEIPDTKSASQSQLYF